MSYSYAGIEYVENGRLWIAQEAIQPQMKETRLEHLYVDLDLEEAGLAADLLEEYGFQRTAAILRYITIARVGDRPDRVEDTENVFRYRGAYQPSEYRRARVNQFREYLTELGIEPTEVQP